MMLLRFLRSLQLAPLSHSLENVGGPVGDNLGCSKPAHAIICNGLSGHVIASAWASVVTLGSAAQWAERPQPQGGA
jgi:hypothetical protein